MSKTILADANSIGHAAHRATKLTVGKQQTQAVFGTIRTIRDSIQRYPGFQPIVLWDDHAQWRYDMWPNYKSKRDDTPEKREEREHYKSQIHFIKRALASLGIRQMSATGYEADDLAGFLSAGLSASPANEVLLLTGDQDWIQMVRKNVTWIDHRDDAKIVTLANLFAKTGYRTPHAFLEGKALQGDTSDTIPGVGGIGEKGAPEFLAEFGSIKGFYDAVQSGRFIPKRKAHIGLTTPEGKAAVLRNMKLMQLLKVEKPSAEATSVVKGKLDEADFRDLCGELCFNSITRNEDSYTNFIRPFRGLAA